MTSVRPKLKPETPKTVTAWETASGKVVWLRADGSWSETPDDIGVFTGEAAEEALAKAKAQEGIVTDPYFMEVTADGKVAGTLYTQSGGKALAYLRYDRATGPLTAGTATLTRTA